MSSSNLRNIRLDNQFEDIQENPPQNWKILKKEQTSIICLVNADNSCPFYDEPFTVKIEVPPEYPKKGTYFFVQKPQLFYHPNIDPKSGYVCQKTILQPMIDIRTRMRAFLFVLSAPNSESCLNFKAGQLYFQNPHSYYKKALKIFRGLKN